MHTPTTDPQLHMRGMGCCMSLPAVRAAFRTWDGREPARLDGLALLGRLARRPLLCLQPQLLRVRLRSAHELPVSPQLRLPSSQHLFRIPGMSNFCTLHL